MAVNTEMVEMWGRARVPGERRLGKKQALYLAIITPCSPEVELHGYFTAAEDTFPQLRIPISERRVSYTANQLQTLRRYLFGVNFDNRLTGAETAMARHNLTALGYDFEGDPVDGYFKLLTGVLYPNKDGSIFTSSSGASNRGEGEWCELKLFDRPLHNPLLKEFFGDRYNGMEAEKVARYSRRLNEEYRTIEVSPLNYHEWFTGAKKGLSKTRDCRAK